MEIVRQRSAEYLELVVKGRLDAYWASSLTNELERAVRAGDHHVRLHFGGVTYISSIGIRVLVQFYKQLDAIHGSLAVSSPSEPVKRILDMAGLGSLLILSTAGAAAPAGTAGRQLESRTALYEVFEAKPGVRLECRLLGNPDLLEDCRFGPEHSACVQFPASSLGIGLGAFGNDFEECQNRYGEFLALAGAAAYLPTDGSNVPDYLVAEGSFVPELQVLYGAVCEGEFPYLVRFEARGEAVATPLSELVETCLEIGGRHDAAIAVVAESAGLLGAALRRSPAGSSENGALFRHPGIRQWLSFSAERTHSRALAVVAGVATRSLESPLAKMVRPLGGGSKTYGHFHAAAFSYRPLKKGRLELAATVQSVFQTETLHGVLHLLPDEREAAGAGQSELVRGACWVGPLAEITAEKN